MSDILEFISVCSSVRAVLLSMGLTHVSAGERHVQGCEQGYLDYGMPIAYYLPRQPMADTSLINEDAGILPCRSS